MSPSDADRSLPNGMSQEHKSQFEDRGRALLVRAPTAPVPQRWIVDPEFAGAFALGGVVCQVVGEIPEAGQLRLKVRFESLSATAERDIVRQVYQQQLLEAEGRNGSRREGLGHDPARGPEGPGTVPGLALPDDVGDRAPEAPD